MDRRYFLKYLPYFGVFTFKIQHLFAGLISQLFDSTDEKFTLTLFINGSTPVEFTVWRYRKLLYISTLQFARALDYHTYFNDKKKKIVLYLPQKQQVVVTANNSYIKIDNNLYQIPAQAFWYQGEIFVPLQYFTDLLNRHTSLHLNFKESDQTLSVTQQDINITNVNVLKKENGTVIRIRTTKNFKAEEITADMRYGWLHVDFYTGKIDQQQLSKIDAAGIVSKFKTFQFPELASLAFYLTREPVSKEIIPKPDQNEVLVVLRTRQDISDEDLAELREEDDPEVSDELKRQLEEERSKWKIDVVVIDAGHGGKDPGTVGRRKLYEKDIVLPIALKLGNIIKKEMPDVKVVYTRSTDKFIPLRRRTQIANENNGKVFISIHANANDNHRVSGFETYILGPEKGEQARRVVLEENSVIKFEDANTRSEYEGINKILSTMAQNAFTRQSEYLASLVQQNLYKELRSLKLPNRGVKQGPFWVMVGATMPNILVETGFVSNSYDSKILRTGSYQKKIAYGIFNGFKQFKRDYENAI